MSGITPRIQRRILSAKINDWLSTIEDEHVRKLAAKDTIVTGGSIASMCLGDNINDFDVYFKTKETTEAVAHYYVNLFNKNNPQLCNNPKVITLVGNMGCWVDSKHVKDGVCTEDCYLHERFNALNTLTERPAIRVQSSGVVKDGEDDNTYEYFEMTDNEHGDKAFDYLTKMTVTGEEKVTSKYRPVFLSENAITLSDKLQIVIRFYGKPEEIHNNYDFVHAMSYYEHNNTKLVLKQDALESIMSKRLYYVGSLYPVCSLFRLRKFIERGWHVSGGEILKIAMQISKLDLFDIHVLKEQLTGVDAAYFHQIITALEANPGADITTEYITEIINRVFNN